MEQNNDENECNIALLQTARSFERDLFRFSEVRSSPLTTLVSSLGNSSRKTKNESDRRTVLLVFDLNFWVQNALDYRRHSRRKHLFKIDIAFIEGRPRCLEMPSKVLR